MFSNPRPRVFFGFMADGKTRAGVADCVSRLPWRTCDRLRWLPESDWHVTLRFVGEVKETTARELCEAMPEVAGAHADFDLPLLGVEVFPSCSSPAVIAATGPTPAPAQRLVDGLEDLCRSVHLPAERRDWRPHMTVARVRGRKALNLKVVSVNQTLPVTQVCLLESLPVALGHRYVPVCRAALL